MTFFIYVDGLLEVLIKHFRQDGLEQVIRDRIVAWVSSIADSGQITWATMGKSLEVWVLHKKVASM